MAINPISSWFVIRTDARDAPIPSALWVFTLIDVACVVVESHDTVESSDVFVRCVACFFVRFYLLR
jgi:hypothetical protein